MTDVGVNAVGEIERGGAGRQIDNLALRRHDIDPLLRDVALKTRHQAVRHVAVSFPLEHLAHPGNPPLAVMVGPAAFLVRPVRGYPELGVLVHLRRADLNFQCLTLRSDDRSVQRAIVVRLGVGEKG